MKKMISRRNFLKVAGASAAALAPMVQCSMRCRFTTFGRQKAQGRSCRQVEAFRASAGSYR